VHNYKYYFSFKWYQDRFRLYILAPPKRLRLWCVVSPLGTLKIWDNAHTPKLERIRPNFNTWPNIKLPTKAENLVKKSPKWHDPAGRLYAKICSKIFSFGPNTPPLHRLGLHWPVSTFQKCATIFPLFIHYRVIFTHADGSRRVRLFTSVCLSVCLSVFPHGISKTDAAGITKLDIEVCTMIPRNPFILGSEGQGHESQKQCRRGPLRSFECWLFLV